MREDLFEEFGATLLASQARHLDVHGEGFVGLTDDFERLSEQRERIEIFGVRLEGDLQLGERLHARLRLVALQVELGGGARVERILAEVQDALDHLERVVGALQVEQQAGTAWSERISAARS